MNVVAKYEKALDEAVAEIAARRVQRGPDRVVEIERGMGTASFMPTGQIEKWGLLATEGADCELWVGLVHPEDGYEPDEVPTVDVFIRGVESELIEPADEIAAELVAAFERAGFHANHLSL